LKKVSERSRSSSTSSGVTPGDQLTPPIDPSALSPSCILHFLINQRGTSFWPIFFLPYTTGWDSFLVQLACVSVVLLIYPLRFSTFWFHFSGKSNISFTTPQLKGWIVGELRSKVNMLEYRKNICTEFAFHFLSELISLVSFFVIAYPLCSLGTADYQQICHIDGGSHEQAVQFVGIAIIILSFAFLFSLLYMVQDSGQSLLVLFTPWLTLVHKHFFLMLIIVTSSLIYPYQFLLLHNKIVW